MKKRLLLIIPILGMLLSGCGNDKGNAIPVESVSLDETAISLPVDTEKLLTATVSPKDATDKSVKWTTSDKTVASVLGGLVHAYSVGTAEIVATTIDGGKTAKCVVNVSEKIPEVVHVSNVVLNKTELTLGLGEKQTLTATILPANAQEKGVTWSTSADGVATVDNGEVTGVASGTAVITATSKELVEGVKISASCAVTVDGGEGTVHVTGVTVSPKNTSVQIKHTVQLSKSIEPSDATDKSVTWVSDTPSIATVSQSGLVTGVTAGTAHISVTTNDGDFSDVSTVEVTPPPASAYSAVIGGVSIPLYLYEGEKDGEWKNQYYANIAHVTAKETISFKHNSDTIAFTAPGEGNNAAGDPCKVVASADNVTVYLKEFESEFQVWLSGYHMDYYVKVGSGSPIALEKSSETPEHFTTQYESHIDVTSGDILSFFANEDELTVTGDSAGGNNVSSALKVKTTAVGVGVYLKLSGEGNQCWLSGYVPTYSMKINSGELIELEPSSESPEGFSAQYEKLISVEEDDVLSFFLDGESFSTTGEDNEINNVSTSLEVRTTAADVKVYLKIKNGEGWCWLAGFADPVYSVSINGGAFQTLTANEGKTEYFLKNIDLYADDTIEFKRNAKVLEVIPSADIMSHYNNIHVVAGQLVVIRDVAAKESHGIFLKMTNPYEVWVNGPERYEMEINRNDGTLEGVPLTISDTSDTEYWPGGTVQIEYGETFKFYIGFETYDATQMKIAQGSSPKFVDGTDHWLECRGTGTYDLYVETISDGEKIKGIYISDKTEYVHVFVTLGSGSEQPLTYNSLLEQWELSDISLVSGTNVYLSDGTDPIQLIPGTAGTNNIRNGKIIVSTIGGVYFKKEGNAFVTYISGFADSGRQIVVNDVYYEALENTSSEYKLIGITLSTGDEICAAYHNGTKYNVALDPYGAHESFEVVDGVLYCKVAGIYDIYLKQTGSGFDLVYIQ